MSNSVLAFFEKHLALKSNTTSVKQDKETVRLAAAIVMVELSQVNLEVKSKDRKIVIEELAHYFPLSKEAATLLEHQAEQADESLTSLFPYTKLVNKYYDEQDKYHLIEALWDITYQIASDEHFDIEDAYCHKIANLLYIPHSRVIHAKLIAEQKYKEEH